MTYLNKDDILGDGKASYTPDYTGGTLTFTGTPAISGLTNNAVIAVDGIDLTIVAPSNGLTLNSSSYGIWINGDKDLTLEGDIRINSAATGISTFSSGVDVTVNGKLTINSDMNGVWTPDGDFTLNGEMVIDQACIGVYANNVKINGNIPEAYTSDNTIHANGDVTIDGNMIASGATVIKSDGDITLVSGNLVLTGNVAAMDAKGTISIPVTHRIKTPWQGEVMQKDNHTYIVDTTGDIAKVAVIEEIDCDVNKDDAISIADVTALINIILGNSTEGQYNLDAADVNGDTQITIADVMTLVNIILSGLSK